MSDKIIYGKNPLDKIVSIEVNEDKVEVFRQLGDKIVSEFLPHRYWLLCNKIPNKETGWIRLDGNLHYKYGKQYVDKKEYLGDRARLRKFYDIYSISNPQESVMVKDGLTYYKGLHPQDIAILSFDIESAGLLGDSFKETYIISNTFRNSAGSFKKMFCLDEYDNDEALMIQDWCEWVRTVDPSIMVGHNVFGYDFPYLSACAGKYGMSLDLGRDGSAIEYKEYTSEYRVDGSQTWEYTRARIYGREIIDTAFLSVKYDVGRKFPSWGLKSIIAFLGLEKEGRQHYDASTIRKNWKIPSERAKIKKYAEEDSDDALKLFDKMIAPFFYITQSVPKSFQDVINGASGSWLNAIFLRAYVQDKHSIPKASEVEPFEGAISFGSPGIYRNVQKWDVASLYPSIMRQYKICDEYKDPKRFFSEVVEYFTIERLKHKKLAKDTGNSYHDNMQGSLKILINSLYGFLGAPGLNFNSPSNAARVTELGREILNKSILWATDIDIDGWRSEESSIKGLGKFILVNCDTDSIAVCKPDETPITREENKKYTEELNSLYPDLISWEDDGYYDTFIVFKAKNYVMRNAEDGEITYKGSALKDSKKEPALKEMQFKMIHDLVDYNGVNLAEIYSRYVSEVAYGIKDISRWCVKKTVSKAILENERANESKVRDAFNGRQFSEGEKIYIFNDIEGEVPAMAKGEVITNKKGEVKMIPNRIYRLREDYNNSYDKEHYLNRVYDATNLFDTVIDTKIFTNFSLKRNIKALGLTA